MAERWETHTCQGCGDRFEVGYDERDPERRGPVEADVACPGCGKIKIVPVPRGFESALLVRAADEDEPDEGLGG